MIAVSAKRCFFDWKDGCAPGLVMGKKKNVIYHKQSITKYTTFETTFISPVSIGRQSRL